VIQHPIAGVAYLRSADVARMEGVALRTVGKWLERGLLVPTWRTLGGHARFAPEDLAEQVARIRKTAE
jgi:DNA-binding transcriptional MerR regulator